MTPFCRGAVPGVESTHPAAGDGGAPFDIALAGAGLAAMSLAVRLSELPDAPHIVLIDPRTEFPHDRTWCHWQLHQTPFDPAITHRWPQWTVRSSPRATTRRGVNTPYVRIPSDQFYKIAMEKLSLAPQVTFLRGLSVTEIESHPDHTTLRLSDGQRINSAWAFDNRPPESSDAPWRQIFRGLELHSPEANLDTGTVTLMDFQSANSDGIRFFYVLPLDQHTALVEDTWLAPRGKAPQFSDQEILTYAHTHLASVPWQIRHREEGNLPMGFLPSAASAPSAVNQTNRIIPWGTAAGAVRASSGYAFSRIQRASAAMADHWSQHGRPNLSITHESNLLAWMDRVFLRTMERHPERVPEFFLRMFDRVPPEALVRFLESEPRPADILRVMRALPAAPFLAAALP
ncbi:MAG: lycopene cyclase family protein [Pirellulales bacterium]